MCLSSAKQCPHLYEVPHMMSLMCKSQLLTLQKKALLVISLLGNLWPPCSPPTSITAPLWCRQRCAKHPSPHPYLYSKLKQTTSVFKYLLLFFLIHKWFCFKSWQLFSTLTLAFIHSICTLMVNMLFNHTFCSRVTEQYPSYHWIS